MSDNLSGPQKSDSLKYNGKYDSSKFFTPDLKLDSKAVKTETVDLSTSKIDSYAKDDINFTDKTSINKYISEQGDINGDGEVDIRDFTALQKGLVGKGEIPDGIGDINGDGKITVKDALVLQKYLAGDTDYFEDPNSPISEPFTPPDSDKPIQSFDDDGTLIDSYTKDDINFIDKTSIDKYISKQGDINGDGEVDIRDFMALQKGLVGKGEIPDGIGDINGDGKITVKDATVLQKYFAGKEVQVNGVNENVSYNDTGFVSFEDANVHYISVEQGHSGAAIGKSFGPLGTLVGMIIAAEHNNSAVCDTLSGCCETEDYYIISYKSGDDSKQRIKLYNKKTWEVEKEFTTDCLDHTNGLTTDGKYVYIANCAGKKQTVTKFRLDDPALDSNSEPNLETDHFDISKTSEGEKITGIAFDYTNKNVCVAAQADDLYISKADGTVTHVKKVKVPEGYPNTPQDICVANDKIYVIRTKDPKVPVVSTGQEGCNMIDIYDIDGNYVESKTLDLPGSFDSNGEFINIYRELESVSFDESTQSFTLYYTSPDYGWNKATGNHESPPHVVVTGVKFD